MENLSEKKLLHPSFQTGAKDPESYTDEQIINSILEGNTELFEILIRRYNQQLFRIIRGYLTNKQDIEDVMQTSYMKAFENLNQFRGEARFSTWLIRIAINETLKKKKGRDDISDLVSVRIAHKQDPVTCTPETNLIQEDMNEHLEKAIDKLPSKYRSVIIMREIEQLSTKETARIMNVSPSNVKVRLHRAKKMLRDQFAAMLRDTDLFPFRGIDCNKMTRRIMNLIKNRQN